MDVIWKVLPFFAALMAQDLVESSLIGAQVIFRHGIRNIGTPFPTDPYRNESLWSNGYDQLSCEGKVQCYNLGRQLRKRYGDNFISPTYQRSEMHALSSDLDRTIQSAISFLAGFYPSNERVDTCNHIPWKDIPIHSLPENVDNIIYQQAPCPKYWALLYHTFSTAEEFRALIKCTEEERHFFYRMANVSMNNFGLIDYLKFIPMYDNLVVERDDFNMTLPSWGNKVLAFQNLRRLHDFYFTLATYTKEMRLLRAGPLLQKIVSNFNLSRSNEGDKGSGKRMHLFSAHDQTLTSLLDLLGFYKDGVLERLRPSSAAAFIIELHKLNTKLQLKFFYKNASYDDGIPQLVLPECGEPCFFPKFMQLTSSLTLANGEWRKQCRMSNLQDKANGQRKMSVSCIIPSLIFAVLLVTVWIIIWKYKNYYFAPCV